jgi:hypothetical protein
LAKAIGKNVLGVSRCVPLAAAADGGESEPPGPVAGEAEVLGQGRAGDLRDRGLAPSGLSLEDHGNLGG